MTTALYASGDSNPPSLKSILIDQSYIEEINRQEDEFENALKRALLLISKFNDFARNNNVNDIKNSEDFFSQHYLEDPQYSIDSKNMLAAARELREFFINFLSNFINNIVQIMGRTGQQNENLESTLHDEIQRLEELVNMLQAIIKDEYKLPVFNPKKAKDAIHELRLRIGKFDGELKFFENEIRNVQNVSRIKFASRDDFDEYEVLYLKESKLEHDVASLIQSYNQSRERYESKISSSANDAEKHELLSRLHEINQWLMFTFLNLINLYLSSAKTAIKIEINLTAEELHQILKVRKYHIIIIKIPDLFKEVLGLSQFIEKLRQLSAQVVIHSKELLETGHAGGLQETDKMLEKIDWMLWEEEDLLAKRKELLEINANNEEILDIIPRELRIQGADGTVLSGDLYLKDKDSRPTAAVIAIPSFATSRRIYYPPAVRAAKAGFLCYIPDIPSQGYSSGEFNFGPVAESMLLAIRYLKKNFGIRKIGLIGVSLGAMVSLYSLMHYTKKIDDEIERIDKALIQISESKADYRRLFDRMFFNELIMEFTDLNNLAKNQIRNIESKEKIIAEDRHSYEAIKKYTISYKGIFESALQISEKILSYIESIRKKSNKISNRNIIQINILTGDFNKIKDYINSLIIRDELFRNPMDFEKQLAYSRHPRDISNLFSSCISGLEEINRKKSLINERLDEAITKLLILRDSNLNLGTLKDSYLQNLRNLIIREYAKYSDCYINAILLLAPVPYPQTGFRLRKLQELFEKFEGKGNQILPSLIHKDTLYPAFVDLLLFIAYREFARSLAESLPNKKLPVGSRFHFRKNPYLKAVRDKEMDEGAFKKLMRRFKLITGEDPVQLGSLKIWDKASMRKALLAPNHIKYFALLQELCPELIENIKKVPKLAIFGAKDELTSGSQEGIIKMFEEFGQLRTIRMEGMGHYLEFEGDKNNLFMNPVLAQYAYEFFMLVSNS